MGPTERHEPEDAPKGRPQNVWERPIFINSVPGAYDEYSKGVWSNALFPVSQGKGSALWYCSDLRPIASQSLHFYASTQKRLEERNHRVLCSLNRAKSSCRARTVVKSAFWVGFLV